MTKRKPRSDRNHVVYCITCQDTQKQYIGITVIQNSNVAKQLDRRLQQHLWRAETEQKSWSLCAHLRKYKNMIIDPMAVVRGKAAAHELEVALVDMLQPELNTKRKSATKN